MDIINNISKTLKDDLVVELKKDSRVSIAASCFSMYAYRELKKQFEGVAGLRFIFTSPAFLAEKDEPKRREFYIPRAVFRDSSFASSPAKINVFELFKLHAPDTKVKVI